VGAKTNQGKNNMTKQNLRSIRCCCRHRHQNVCDDRCVDLFSPAFRYLIKHGRLLLLS